MHSFLGSALTLRAALLTTYLLVLTPKIAAGTEASETSASSVKAKTPSTEVADALAPQPAIPSALRPTGEPQSDRQAPQLSPPPTEPETEIGEEQLSIARPPLSETDSETDIESREAQDRAFVAISQPKIDSALSLSPSKVSDFKPPASPAELELAGQVQLNPHEFDASALGYQQYPLLSVDRLAADRALPKEDLPEPFAETLGNRLAPDFLEEEEIVEDGALDRSQGADAPQNRLESEDSMGTITAVSALADVQPTDWAFSALQSLIERYGVIAGYPDRTFRGNRTLSRYEFAAALQGAIARLEQLLETNTANSIPKSDLLVLQRLQEEFATDLAALQGKVDLLEARTAELESNQFSTTTTLTGEVSFVFTQAFSPDLDTVHILQQRNQLFFNTSFTGTDLLVLAIQSGNANDPDLQGGTGEGILASQVFGDTNGNLPYAIGYILPLSKRLQLNFSGRAVFFSFLTPTLNPFLEDADRANGALSAFAQSNPIYRLGGGAGFGFNYAIAKSLLLSANYLASNERNPQPGAGLFNGNYSLLTQLTLNPRQPFSIAFTYANSYFRPGQFAYGRGTSLSLTGTRVANTLNDLRADSPVVANSYGLEATWKINQQVTLSGWVGLTKARLLGKGDAEIWNYAITLAFPDLFQEGALGGFIFGVEPTLRGLDVPNAEPFNRDFAYHVEAFYRHPISNNISFTPGFIWLLSPNQDAENSDVFIGVLRTTFSF